MKTKSYVQRFEEMKRYVRFSAEDVARLHRLRPLAQPHFDAIARAFYERTREHEDAHAVFQDEAQIARLHQSMVRWLDRVLTGPYDAEYCEKSARIGERHHRIGLPQRFMFTGMSVLRKRLQAIAESELPEEAPAIGRSLMRVLDIELGLMCETYLDAHVDRIRRYEQQTQERALAVLEATARRSARAMELATTIIIGLDGAGRIQLFNAEASRVSGYEADELFGKSLRDDLLACEQGGCDLDAVLAPMLSGERMSGESGCVLRTKSGRVREVQLRLVRAPLDDDDVVIYVQGEDITGRRAMAERQRRTERLAAIGTLAAGLAHEIRNPLNGAQLHLTYLKRALACAEQPQPELLDAVDVVASEIRRLSELVSDFLDFARPRPLKRERVSIRELCRRAVQLLLADAERAGASLELDLPSGELEASVDAAMLEQVLLNLLRNAIDAVAEGGGGRVALRTYREPRHAVIEVRDDGPGLGNPDAPIFDAFYSTKPNGTGLGLAIVHRIVGDHGGMVAATSRPGETVFRIQLPIDQQAMVDEDERPVPSVTVHPASTK